MSTATPEKPFTRVTRMWMHPPFMKALEKRERERQLIDSVLECVARIRDNPTSPGLNFEFIKRCGAHRVFSARISRSYRMAVVQLGPTEAGLLYFDNHDETYSWIDHQAKRIPTMLARLEEVPRTGPVREPLPIPRAHEDDSIAVPDAGAIRRMLERGMSGYLAYLDDDQRSVAEIDISERAGLTLVKGGAGTGKTAIAIARVRHLATRPDLDRGPVIYLCFSRVLAGVVGSTVANQFGGRYPRGQVEVGTIHQWCFDYLERQGRKPASVVGDREDQQRMYRRILHQRRALAGEALAGLTAEQILDEIKGVIRPNGFAGVEDYLATERKGMRFPLKRPQRQAIWEVNVALDANPDGVREYDELPELALAALREDASFVPYRGVVLDEAQDCGAVMIRLAKALTGGDDRRLFVLADPAQSVFRNGFYWGQRELQARGGQVNILRKTYRTTRQVHRLAGSVFADDADMTRSIEEAAIPERDGPPPVLSVVSGADEEAELLCGAIVADLASVEPKWRLEQLAVIAPENQTLRRLADALTNAGVAVRVRDERHPTVNLNEPAVKVMTIHAAKGLDFPLVYVAGLTKNAFRRMANEEKSLFYVAMTRAGYALQLFTQVDDPHPLLYELDPEAYRLEGVARHLFEGQRDNRQAAW
ncbi:MAG: 3'-5' exonuclease [Dehalococcoidia bacterium]